MRDKLTEGHLMPGHDFSEQQGAYRGVALRQIELGANAPGFLAAHQNVVFEHPLANVFEADRHLVHAAAVTGRDLVEQLSGGERLGQIAADLPGASEMPE